MATNRRRYSEDSANSDRSHESRQSSSSPRRSQTRPQTQIVREHSPSSSRSRSPSPSPSIESRSPQTTTTASNKKPKKENRLSNADRKASKLSKASKSSKKAGNSEWNMNVSDARRMMSARRIKIEVLRNENDALRQQFTAIVDENRSLKRSLITQSRSLDRYEVKEAEMGSIVARKAEEVRVVQDSQRRAKERNQALERRLKEQADDIHNKNKLLTKLKSLVIDKELPERDDLNRQLAKVKTDLDAINEKTAKLENHAKLLSKNHKHEMGIERVRLRDAQSFAARQQAHIEKLQQQVEEKDKLLDFESKKLHLYLSVKAKQTSSPRTDRQQPTPVSHRNRKFSEPTMPVNVGLLLRDDPSSMTVAHGNYKELLPEVPSDHMDGDDNSHQQAMEGERDRARKDAEEEAQRIAEEQRVKDALEQEERERIERQRIEWEHAERERHEREVREKWEREQREKEQQEQIERERQLQEEHERELQAAEKAAEAERLQFQVQPTKIDERDRNDLLEKLFMIDKKAGKDTSVEEFNLHRKEKVYQFSQPVENLHRGRPAHGSKENSSSDAGYMPSYGPGRTDGKQKTFNADDKTKKSNLLEDLFGKQNASNNNNSNELLSEREKTTSAQQLHARIHHRRATQSTTTAVTRPTVNAVNKVEDDLEELLL